MGQIKGSARGGSSLYVRGTGSTKIVSLWGVPRASKHEKAGSTESLDLPQILLCMPVHLTWIVSHKPPSRFDDKNVE